jgi:hypothetical protein
MTRHHPRGPLSHRPPTGGTLLDVIPLPETEKVLLIVAHVVPASSAPLNGTGPSVSLPRAEASRGVEASTLATDFSGAEVAQAECLETLGTPLRASTTAPKTNAIDAPGPEAGRRPSTREQANHLVATPAVRTVSRPRPPAVEARATRAISGR